MRKKLTKSLFLAAMVFHLAACSFQPTAPPTHPAQPASSTARPTLLNKSQTHLILAAWKNNNYHSTKSLPITLHNHHPLAQHFHSIISGKSIARFAKKSTGVGIPVLIKTQPHSFTNITKTAYLTNLHTATLIATQSAGKIHLFLLDPLTTKAWQGHPLATQHNIRIDYLTSLPGNSALKFKGLLRPAHYSQHEGIYLSRPYDKNRIPIIMIHGIIATPASFMDMAQAIENHPDLYRKYQIWHYYYPTGSPWLATAHRFRTTVRSLIHHIDPHHNNPKINQTIIVAHSMGGLISRTSLSHPGNALQTAYLGNLDPKKFLTTAERQQLQPYFHFTPLRSPAKVIFLATPHRGSRLAKGIAGWCANRLITLPHTLIKGAIKPLTHRRPDSEKLPATARRLLTHQENAVAQLRPDNPAILALQHMPLRKNLQTFSIIGDIAPWKLRFYTDGVVSYCSAHLPPPTQEIIVHANHDIGDEPPAIQAVINILRN